LCGIKEDGSSCLSLGYLNVKAAYGWHFVCQNSILAKQDNGILPVPRITCPEALSQ
jgi:hypothetical protein